MQVKKIIIGILAFIFFGGTACTVAKKALKETENINDINKIILNVYRNNLTDLGFYIQKGKILVKEGKNKLNFIYSAKYARKDIYLISIRGLNGFEAIRIFINSDSIYINDRINKELLLGNRNDFERITGIPVEFLKICFGDIIDYSKGTIINAKTEGNKLVINGIVENIQTVSAIDKGIYKVSYVKLANSTANEYITIEYRRYLGENHILPGEVIIYDSKREVEINIRNKRFIVPWYGDIEFIPGLNYKRRHIE